MLDRRACQRRVYRLATLLTGNPNSALRVVRAVVDAQPDLRRLDSAHMDRLTILRSREIRPAMIVHERLEHAIARAVAGLPHQQREAWVLCEVYAMSEREAARAMDCSVAATRTHLENAGGRLAEALGDRADDAEEAMRRYSLALDLPALYVAEIRRRAARKRVLVALGLVVAVAAVGGAIIWLTRM